MTAQARSLTKADTALEAQALISTRLLPTDAALPEYVAENWPGERYSLIFHQAGFGLLVENRPDGNGTLTAQLLAATIANTDGLTVDRLASDQEAPLEEDEVWVRYAVLCAYRFAAKDMQEIVAAFAPVCQQLVRLRLGGWHVSASYGGTYYACFQVFNPLEPTDQTTFHMTTLPQSPTSKRKALKALGGVVVGLAKLSDTPVRYDNVEFLAQLECLDASARSEQSLGMLALARWPELEGPFLAAVIERAADLKQEGMDAAEAVERAGTLPLAGPGSRVEREA